MSHLPSPGLSSVTTSLGIELTGISNIRNLTYNVAHAPSIPTLDLPRLAHGRSKRQALRVAVDTRVHQYRCKLVLFH